MKGSRDLNKTWVLVQCGNKKFTLNYNFISSMEDFKQAECLSTPTSDSVKRGVYSVLGMNLMVLDGRRLLGEPSITSLKLKFSEDIHELKSELLKWLECIEWYILANKEVELDYTKLSFYTWVIGKSGINDIDNIKDRLIIAYKENFILANNIVEAKNDINRCISEPNKIFEEIKDNINNNMFKLLNRIITLYNKSFNETCIIIRHKGRRYGLTIDKILAITEHVEIKPIYSEYKIIAGKCFYQNECYDVFNISYITDLAKKLENS